MTDLPAVRWAGSVRWAVVPFAPAPPFRLYAGERHPPIVAPDVESLIAAARGGGDPELTYLVSGKARPILVLGEPPSRHHREVAALRLLRLSTLTPDEQMRVRDRQDELLFHLPPARHPLPEESAAIVSALVRVHVDAIGSDAPVGQLDGAEMAELGERIIRHYGFDTRRLLERRIQELVARRRRRGAAT